LKYFGQASCINSSIFGNLEKASNHEISGIRGEAKTLWADPLRGISDLIAAKLPTKLTNATTTRFLLELFCTT
jgi:hypothetical protein